MTSRKYKLDLLGHSMALLLSSASRRPLRAPVQASHPGWYRPHDMVEKPSLCCGQHGLQHCQYETTACAVRPCQTPCSRAVLHPCRLRKARAGQVWHPLSTSHRHAVPTCQWRACQPWRAGQFSTGCADGTSTCVRRHLRPPQAPRFVGLAGQRGQPCGPYVSGLAVGLPLGR